MFSLCGIVKKVYIAKRYFDRPYLFGNVHFDSMEEKKKAKKYFNGKMFGEKFLSVNDFKIAEVKVRSKASWDCETVYEEEREKS